MNKAQVQVSDSLQMDVVGMCAFFFVISSEDKVDSVEHAYVTLYNKLFKMS